MQSFYSTNAAPSKFSRVVIPVWYPRDPPKSNSFYLPSGAFTYYVCIFWPRTSLVCIFLTTYPPLCKCKRNLWKLPFVTFFVSQEIRISRSKFSLDEGKQNSYFLTKVLFTYPYTWQNFCLTHLHYVNNCVVYLQDTKVLNESFIMCKVEIILEPR